MLRTLGTFTFCVLIVLGSRLTGSHGGEQIVQESVFKWEEGDIIFQGGNSAQSRALEQATGSSWTHCAIVFRDENGPYVIEAVQPVRRTELDAWLKRGSGIFSAKRLSDRTMLTPAVIEKMKEVAAGHLGKSYDPYFQWDDERIYCSELVWKVYKEGVGLEVGEVERFGDMDLASPEVRRIMKERYGSKSPLDEPVITPVSIHRSALLHTVREGSALAN